MKNLLAYLAVCCILTADDMPSETVSYFKSSAGLHCVRIRDELTISFGERKVYYSEIVTIATKVRPDNLISEINRVSFFILPVLCKDPRGNRLLFPVLKPTVAVTSGRVEDVAFKRSDGIGVEDASALTEDGMYRLMIVFGKEIPEEFTIVISMDVQRDAKNYNSELLCKFSDDGMGRIFGKHECMLRVLNCKGTKFVFRSGDLTLQGDARGWVRVEAEMECRVEADLGSQP